MLLKAVCFLTPLTLAIQIDAGSQIFATEMLLPIVAFLVNFSKNKIDIKDDIKILFQIGLAYLFAQIISDIWNSTSYGQYSRGWARLFLFNLNLFSIYMIVNHKRSYLLLFAFGFAFGRAWTTLSGLDGDVIPWKIGMAKPIALAAILFCIVLPLPQKTKLYVTAAVLLGLAIFDILMDFRSHGVVLTVVAVLLLSSSFLSAGAKRYRVSAKPPVFVVALAGLFAAAIAYQFYVYAAESDWLSERATSRFETQVEEAEVPLLIAGRSEAFVYIEAILDSILIGHGSWPENSYYAEKLVDERYEHGLSTVRAKPKDASVPLHSHFFGGWIEAGLVGGVYWTYIIVLIFKSLLRSSVGTSHMRPLYLYGAVLLLWDIFFSPFSGFRRLETAFLMVIVLRSLLQRGSKSKRSKKTRRNRSRSSNERRGVQETPLRRRQAHGDRRHSDSLPSRIVTIRPGPPSIPA